MIYVFENQNNSASIVYAEETLTPEQKAKGIAVEKLPVLEELPGKIAVLKCRKSTGEVWYEYVDSPTDLESELADLKQSQADQDELIMQILLGGVS